MTRESTSPSPLRPRVEGASILDVLVRFTWEPGVRTFDKEELLSREKMICSPTHYVGGKRPLLPDILERLPAAASYAEPFCGGAAVSLNLAAGGARVHASDVDEVVVNYWTYQLHHQEELYETVQSLLPIREGLDAAGYRTLRAKLDAASGVEQAALFFICQRVSFSGLGRSGGASLTKDRLTPTIVASILRLRPGPMSVEAADYRDALERYRGSFFYLDPPYDIRTHLYGPDGAVHAAFDHEALFEAIKDRRDWLLSYNDCETVREMYLGFVVEETNPKHVCTAHRRERELLISPRRTL